MTSTYTNVCFSLPDVEKQNMKNMLLSIWRDKCKWNASFYQNAMDTWEFSYHLQAEFFKFMQKQNGYKTALSDAIKESISGIIDTYNLIKTGQKVLTKEINADGLTYFSDNMLSEIQDLLIAQIAEGAGNSIYDWIAGITVFCSQNTAGSLWQEMQLAQTRPPCM